MYITYTWNVHYNVSSIQCNVHCYTWNVRYNVHYNVSSIQCNVHCILLTHGMYITM